MSTPPKPSCPTEVDFPRFWKTRWDIITFDLERQREQEALDACTGPGNCHGCLSWCTFCGSVHDVCHVLEWPDRCDIHQRHPAKPKANPAQLVLAFEQLADDVHAARP